VKQIYSIKALWDDEAKVFISESDIIGLHIEADTIEEFEAVMHDVALELILENHISAPDMVSKPIKEWAPAILWQRPTANKPTFA
jgi:Domain of unknown function (DUF1902)